MAAATVGRGFALVVALVPALADDAAPGRRLWGTFTAEASNPVFSSSVSVSGAAPSPLPPLGTPLDSPLALSPVTGPMLAAERQRLAARGQQSTEIASGIVEAFLHKQELQPGELQCLVDGSGQVAGDLGVTAAHTVNLLEQLLGLKKPQSNAAGAGEDEAEDEAEGEGADNIAALVDSMMTKSAAQTKKQPGSTTPKAVLPVAAQQAQSSLGFFYGSRRLLGVNLEDPAVAMGAGAMMIELAFSGQQMVQLTHDIVRRCVHGDALAAFKAAADHMHNLKYLEGHFLANGADIVVELADAVMDWSGKRYRNFGKDIGKAMRKALLSKEGDGRLPEGLPDKITMANISAGLVRGFFGPGFSLDIQTPGGDEKIHVDLHECVSKNMRFFQSIWSSALMVVARKEAQTGKGSETFGKQEEAVEFGTMLAFTMMQLPSALKRCNLGKEEEQMLMDAIKAMGSGSSVHVETPQMRVTKQDVAKNMAQTVKDWSHMDYYTFGKDLGLLMQKLTATMFPKLYSVQDGRLLRRQLLRLSDSSGSGGVGNNSQFVPLCLAFVAAFLLATAVALKSRRPLAAWQRQWCSNEKEQQAICKVEVDDVEVPSYAYGPHDAAE